MLPVLEHIHHHLTTLAPELIRNDKKAVLGISGGPDSMLLLWAIKEIIPAEQLFVVHVNYQLRGADSDKDQQLVEDACEMWGIECGAFRIDSTPGLAKGENFQDWARRERYRIFDEIARAEVAVYVLTAHHQDDQLETLFMRILRGSGIRAWQGMAPKGPLPTRDERETDASENGHTPQLLRPMLRLTRKQIMQTVQQEHIPYRMDLSNEESTYARNFLRNQWTPELQNHFPGWKKNLLQLSDRAAEYKVLIDYALSSCLLQPQSESSSESQSHSQSDQLLARPWTSHQPELQRLILAEWLTRHQVSFTQGQLEAAHMALQTLQTGQLHQFSPELTIHRERDYFLLAKSKPSHRDTSSRIDSEAEQSNPVIYVMTPSLSEEAAHFGLGEASLTLQKRPLTVDENPDNPSTLSQDALYLDMAVIHSLTPTHEPSVLRKWKSGDRIQPLGMQGHQLVSDLLTNHKLTTAQKQKTLVLECGSNLLAVIYPPQVSVTIPSRSGVISELAKCTKTTTECLVIRVKHG